MTDEYRLAFREKASVIPCLVAGLTLPQVLEAVGAVAKLHAWSLTTTVDWQSRVDTMEKREELFKPMIETMHSTYQIVKDAFPNHFGSLDIDKVMRMSSLETMKKYMELDEQHMDLVLTHGDFWANNVLYEKRSDGTVTDRLVALLDFQLAVK